VLVAALAGCTPAGEGPPELLVFAAASLADALDEISAEFERAGEARVVASYGGSQVLAQQIASGAPADVFLSAGEFPVRFLEERGLLAPAPTQLLTNELVVVASAGGDLRPASMADLMAARLERIAIADPELAPAGRYARESLVELGLWDDLEPRLVYAPDVRAAMAYVESGSLDAALVYRTDGLASAKVRVLDIVPPSSYTPVHYPAAIVAGSNNRAAAQRFVDFLRGESAGKIFRNFGFELDQAK
jgi:molybdate transport system substrate-binding protein